MRIQPLLAFTTFLLAGKLAITAELDPDDVPHPCHSACDPVVSIAQECDRRNDNDTSGMDCICGSDQADTQIPRCEACIAQYRTDHPQDEDNDGDDDDDGDSDNDDADPHDNDAYDILTSCGFDTTSYAPTSSSDGGGGGSSSHSSSASPSSNSASHSSSASGHIASPSSHSASASSHMSSAASASETPSLTHAAQPSRPTLISASRSSGGKETITTSTSASHVSPPDTIAETPSAARHSSHSVLMSPPTATTLLSSSYTDGNSFAVPT
ncbi:hypothetical protein BDV19DRAFT_389677 [Aspergillus venezuelensis]